MNFCRYAYQVVYIVIIILFICHVTATDSALAIAGMHRFMQMAIASLLQSVYLVSVGSHTD